MRLLRRRKKLILPSLQLKVTAVFLATSLVMLTLMGLFLIRSLTANTGADSATLDEVLPVVAEAFVLAVVVAIPLTLFIGVLATFLFAGPIYRMQRFLEQTQAGEKPADCFLRFGDELQDFCKLLNETTETLREPEFDHDLDEVEDEVSTAA